MRSVWSGHSGWTLPVGIFFSEFYSILKSITFVSKGGGRNRAFHELNIVKG